MSSLKNEFERLHNTFIICVLFCVSLNPSLVSGTRSMAHREDTKIQVIKKAEEIDKLKSYKNGSIVLFYESYNKATKRMEETLLRANRDLQKYGFRLRKLDCKKFTNVKECRIVDEPITYMFKKGEQQTYDESDVSGMDLTVNQILFFMANAHHDKMMDCSTMDQVNDFVEINSNYLNTVMASFQRKDSDELRRFLEVVMDMGRTVAFILMSGNQAPKDIFNSRGFVIRFYHTLKPAAGELPRYTDISDNANTKKNLKATIVMMNLNEEFKMHQKNLHEATEREKNAAKEHDEMVAGIKQKAMQDLEKKMEAQENRNPSAKLPKKKKKKAIKKEPGMALHAPAGLSEISEDAYHKYSKEMTAHVERTGYLVNEVELRAAIKKTDETDSHILVVLFYVPWDTTFQMFEENYHYLTDKYKDTPNINLVQFDCWAWPGICNEYMIRTYPRLLVFRNGMRHEMNPFEYRNVLQAETIAKHITLWKDPFLPQLNDMRQVEQITDQMKSMFLMGVFANDSNVVDGRQREFEKIALEYYGNIRVGIAVIKEEEVTFKNKKYQLPIVIGANVNGEKGRVSVTSELHRENLIPWIHDHKREKVEQLTYLNFPSLAKINKPFLISFQNRYKDISSLHKFAKRFPDLITVWMDEDCELSEFIVETYQLTGNGSKIIILDQTNKNVFEYREGKKTIGNVAKWVKRCLTEMKESAAFELSSTKEIINEGYDFLNKTDELEKIERQYEEEQRKLEETQFGKPKMIKREATGKGRVKVSKTVDGKYKFEKEDENDDEDEDLQSLYDSYKGLKYRKVMNVHDEL